MAPLSSLSNSLKSGSTLRMLRLPAAQQKHQPPPKLAFQGKLGMYRPPYLLSLQMFHAAAGSSMSHAADMVQMLCKDCCALDSLSLSVRTHKINWKATAKKAKRSTLLHMRPPLKMVPSHACVTLPEPAICPKHGMGAAQCQVKHARREDLNQLTVVVHELAMGPLHQAHCTHALFLLLGRLHLLFLQLRVQHLHALQGSAFQALQQCKLSTLTGIHMLAPSGAFCISEHSARQKDPSGVPQR